MGDSGNLPEEEFDDEQDSRLPLLQGCDGSAVGRDSTEEEQSCREEAVANGQNGAAAADASSAGLLISTLILGKTIVGAGVAALPKAFVALGWVLTALFMLVIVYSTHYSVMVLTRASVATRQASYPGVIRGLLGRRAEHVLEITMVLRCFGLLLVYMIVVADVLAGGGPEFPGLLCDAAGQINWWCSSRPLIMAVVSVIAFAPLSSTRDMVRIAWASFAGLAGNAIWCAVTLLLVGIAAEKGRLATLYPWPDWEQLGDTRSQIFAHACAVIPIIATAYTCQQTVHFIMAKMKPFSEGRMALVSVSALTLCTLFFVNIGLGSAIIFGDKVNYDVLQDYDPELLTPLVGRDGAVAVYAVVRISYLLSVITIFPMQVWPLRQSLAALLWQGTLPGWHFHAVTYAVILITFLLAIMCSSIWMVLQIVGATAGAVIAFAFPGILEFRLQQTCAPHRCTSLLQGSRVSCAWLLLALGGLQAITGIWAAFLPATTESG